MLLFANKRNSPPRAAFPGYELIIDVKRLAGIGSTLHSLKFGTTNLLLMTPVHDPKTNRALYRLGFESLDAKNCLKKSQDLLLRSARFRIRFARA
jgi:hypothetical protein